ncbi:hypothetical protein HJC23_011052 [Cyclotella cryptica]|uniref:Uncharacterized protein n=1 Tax=Cyclotella cryptica TaxID=29204 RepID=A0ABD3PCC9_9STRA
MSLEHAIQMIPDREDQAESSDTETRTHEDAILSPPQPRRIVFANDTTLILPLKRNECNLHG